MVRHQSMLLDDDGPERCAAVPEHVDGRGLLGSRFRAEQAFPVSRRSSTRRRCRIRPDRPEGFFSVRERGWLGHGVIPALGRRDQDQVASPDYCGVRACVWETCPSVSRKIHPRRRIEAAILNRRYIALRMVDRRCAAVMLGEYES